MMIHSRRLVVIGGTILVAASVVSAGLARWSFADAHEDSRVSVPPGESERLGGGPEQQSALADAVVTDREYEAAVAAAVRCIRDAGVPVSDPVWDGARLRYTGGSFATRAQLDAAKPTLQSCYETHLRGIDVARGAGSTP